MTRCRKFAFWLILLTLVSPQEAQCGRIWNFWCALGTRLMSAKAVDQNRVNLDEAIALRMGVPVSVLRKIKTASGANWEAFGTHPSLTFTASWDEGGLLIYYDYPEIGLAALLHLYSKWVAPFKTGIAAFQLDENWRQLFAATHPLFGDRYAAPYAALDFPLPGGKLTVLRSSGSMISTVNSKEGVFPSLTEIKENFGLDRVVFPSRRLKLGVRDLKDDRTLHSDAIESGGFTLITKWDDRWRYRPLRLRLKDAVDPLDYHEVNVVARDIGWLRISLALSGSASTVEVGSRQAEYEVYAQVGGPTRDEFMAQYSAFEPAAFISHPGLLKGPAGLRAFLLEFDDGTDIVLGQAFPYKDGIAERYRIVGIDGRVFQKSDVNILAYTQLTPPF